MSIVKMFSKRYLYNSHPLAATKPFTQKMEDIFEAVAFSLSQNK